MSFLDAKSHDTLFALPELYEEELSRFALSCEDVAFARSHRRSHNRLGFAIQLALIRDLGRTLSAGDLLPHHVFDQMRAESRLGLAIPDNFAEWRAERTATLNAKLKALAKADAENAIPDAELSDRGLSVSPVREEDSDRITTLSRRLYMLVPRIRITSPLAEVHSWPHCLKGAP